jgi:hypothetical protein
MNKQILVTVSLSWCLASCADVGLVRVGTCEVETGPETPCEGMPNTPSIHLNTNSLNVTPRCANAAHNSTIVISVTPPGQNDVASVAIVPKNGTDTWLTGTNSPDKKEIRILVPAWVEDGEHQYSVLLADGRCIVPRVRIE